MPIDQVRRRILGVAAMTAAAAELAPAVVGSAARAAVAPADFPPLRHVHAGPLDIAYVELGPADGPVAILLHGWP